MYIVECRDDYAAHEGDSSFYATTKETAYKFLTKEAAEECARLHGKGGCKPVVSEYPEKQVLGYRVKLHMIVNNNPQYAIYNEPASFDVFQACVIGGKVKPYLFPTKKEAQDFIAARVEYRGGNAMSTNYKIVKLTKAQ